MHVFVSTLSYTHTHTWHILFLLPFCSSLSHSLYNVYVCVYYVYVVCMHVYTMKYVKFFLTSPSLLFRIPLMFSLPCFFFRPSPLFSLVFSRFFFFFSSSLLTVKIRNFPVCCLEVNHWFVPPLLVFQPLAKCVAKFPSYRFPRLLDPFRSSSSLFFEVDFWLVRSDGITRVLRYQSSLSDRWRWSRVKGEFLDLRSEQPGNRNRSFEIWLAERRNVQNSISSIWDGCSKYSRLRRIFEDFTKDVINVLEHLLFKGSIYYLSKKKNKYQDLEEFQRFYEEW